MSAVVTSGKGQMLLGEGNIPVTLRAVTPVDVAFCNNSRTIESALTTIETESLLAATAASYQLSRAELQCGWNTCPLEYVFRTKRPGARFTKYLTAKR